MYLVLQLLKSSGLFDGKTVQVLISLMLNELMDGVMFILNIQSICFDRVNGMCKSSLLFSIPESKNTCAVLCSVVSNSLPSHGLQPTRPLYPWDFPGRNTGVGWYFLLQGILPTQESNPCLLHRQEDSLPVSHLGSPHEKHMATGKQCQNED